MGHPGTQDAGFRLTDMKQSTATGSSAASELAAKAPLTAAPDGGRAPAPTGFAGRRGRGRRRPDSADPWLPGALSLHNGALVAPADHALGRADGLATLLTVLGPEEGMAFAARHDLAVLLIVREEDGFRELMTDSFRRYTEDTD